MHVTSQLERKEDPIRYAIQKGRKRPGGNSVLGRWVHSGERGHMPVSKRGEIVGTDKGKRDGPRE